MKIAAMSDLHGNLPKIEFFNDQKEIEAIIIAGDVCPDFAGLNRDKEAQQQQWLNNNFYPWAEYLRAPLYATYGNHDWLRYAGGLFITNDARDIGRGHSAWFSPWSPEYKGWAWMADEDTLAHRYAEIPRLNVLVSHCPPYGYCDTATGYSEHLGSRALLDAVQRIRPKVLICGHIHGGFGTGTIPLTRVRDDQREHKECKVYNVALLDESYDLVNDPTIIELP